MTKIIGINHLYLTDPRIDSELQCIDQTDRKMLQFFALQAYKGHRWQLGIMPRAGINNLPFDNQVISLTKSDMPEYDPDFNLTWSEITDQRALEIEKLILDRDCRLVVLWSGGIDSTCVLTAILRNFKPANLSQVTVACTIDSIIEHPVFYTKHIVPNFITTDSNKFINNELAGSDCMVIDGFGADQLIMSMGLELTIRHSELLTLNWKKNPDRLIEYLIQSIQTESSTNSEKVAKWYYELTQESIDSLNVPIETYFDFLWWNDFNYCGPGLHSWFYCYRHLGMSWEQYSNKCPRWFRTDEYQLWAMKNVGLQGRHVHTLGSFKRHSKQYIYEYDHDEYYYRYKIKMNSTGRNYNSLDEKPFAITDKFEILYIERPKDIEKIIELLPTHIKR
jgi:hypothetical protein